MSSFMKKVAFVAAVSMGALVSQILAEKDDQADSPSAAATAEPQQKAQSRGSRRMDDVPLQHALLKKDEESDEESIEEKILAALDKPTTVQFLDLALEDCLTFLHEYHGINIWLDKPTLTDEGISLDQPMTMKLTGVRLESVLNLLLQPLQCDWVIQDEVLKITTSDWAYKHPEVRTYDVRTLIDAGHTSEGLIAAITACIEPGTWTAKAVTAGISCTGGVLVVRHSQRTHAEIAGLLDELHEIAAGDENDHEERGKKVVGSILRRERALEAGRRISASHRAEQQ